MNRKQFLTAIGSGSGAMVWLSRTAPARAQAAMPCEARQKWTEGWVRRMMQTVDSELPPETRSKLLEANGRACFSSQHPAPAAHKPEDLDNLIAGLRKWAGEDGVRREGDVVHFQYGKPPGAAEPKCLCPAAPQDAKGLSGTFCQCSVGYVKEMFSRAAGKPVQVELNESLLRGGKACRFTVRL